MSGGAQDLSTFELQAAITAAALGSGRPLFDCGRGQPNWLATVPRAAFFTLGSFAVGEAAAASANDAWGESPPVAGIAARLDAALMADGEAGAAFLREAVRFGIDELAFEPDAWVHELVRAVLGAGYPSPTRMLTHLELVLERYLVTYTASDPAPAGTYRIFATEGAAAAMAYVFRSLQENHIVAPGDAVALATPVFTPYLQIPILEDFGFRVVELASAHNAPHRFEDGFLEQLLDPAIKVFFVINPGNPDSRAITPDRMHQLRDFVLEKRPDLVIVADTAYATFVDGFRGLIADLPRNVICLHSFSKNYGATGNRLGFIAMHEDHVLDDLLAAHSDEQRRHEADRYRSLTANVDTLPFVNRLVADSREVALHNIAGLGTPDQVQMGLFALSHLMPSGQRYIRATRAELAQRLDALLAPLALAPPGGLDSMYYALVDLLAVARARHGEDAADRLAGTDEPTAIALRLATDHGVIVLPGQLFDSAPWDIRISLASLSVGQLSQVGDAIASVVAAAIPAAP